MWRINCSFQIRCINMSYAENLSVFRCVFQRSFLRFNRVFRKKKKWNRCNTPRVRTPKTQSTQYTQAAKAWRQEREHCRSNTGLTECAWHYKSAASVACKMCFSKCYLTGFKERRKDKFYKCTHNSTEQRARFVSLSYSGWWSAILIDETFPT
jgi:hypothetical protein